MGSDKNRESPTLSLSLGAGPTHQRHGVLPARELKRLGANLHILLKQNSQRTHTHTLCCIKNRQTPYVFFHTQVTTTTKTKKTGPVVFTPRRWQDLRIICGDLNSECEPPPQLRCLSSEASRAGASGQSGLLGVSHPVFPPPKTHFQRVVAGLGAFLALQTLLPANKQQLGAWVLLFDHSLRKSRALRGRTKPSTRCSLPPNQVPQLFVSLLGC